MASVACGFEQYPFLGCTGCRPKGKLDKRQRQCFDSLNEHQA